MSISLFRIIAYGLLLVISTAVAILAVGYIRGKREEIKLLIDRDDSSIEVNKLKSFYKYSEKKEPKVVRYIKSLMLRANIRNRYISPYMFLCLSLIILIISFIFITNFMGAIQAFILSFFLATFPEVILYFRSEYMANKADARYIDFLGLLEESLRIRDDINFAMEKAAQFKAQLSILSDYCLDYTFDVSHGFTPMAALNRFISKIDNAQIINLFETLISCNEISGKYLNVVEHTKDKYTDMYDEFLKRKKVARKNRKSILWMIVIVAIINFLTIMINGNVYYLLTNTSSGQIIFTLTILAFIITFYISISAGHYTFD